MQVYLVFVAASLAATAFGAPQSFEKPAVNEVASLVRRVPAETTGNKGNLDVKCYYGPGIPCGRNWGSGFGGYTLDGFQFRQQNRLFFPPMWQYFNSFDSVTTSFSGLAYFGSGIGGLVNHWGNGLVLNDFVGSFGILARSFHQWILSSSSFASYNWNIVQPYMPYIGAFIANFQSLLNHIDTSWGFGAFQSAYSGWSTFQADWSTFLSFCSRWGYDFTGFGTQYGYTPNIFSSRYSLASTYSSQSFSGSSSRSFSNFRD